MQCGTQQNIVAFFKCIWIALEHAFIFDQFSIFFLELNKIQMYLERSISVEACDKNLKKKTRRSFEISKQTNKQTHLFYHKIS